MKWSPGRTVVALVGALVLGSSPSLTPAATAADPVVATLGVLEEPSSLNPFVEPGGYFPFVMTYDRLVGESVTDRAPVPGFASSWSQSTDGRTWTYTVSPDLKWSDGQPATARDIAFTLQLVLDSIGTPSELSVGINSSSRIGDIEKVDLIDDLTVAITTKEVTNTPPQFYCYIVPEHVYGGMTAEQVLTYAPEPPLVGTGPFVVTEWTPGTSIRLDANPYYRGDPDGHRASVGAVVIQFFSSVDAMAQALKRGEVDVVTVVPISQYDQLDADPSITGVSWTSSDFVNLAFNVADGEGGGASTAALADPAFRDALGYALDRDMLVDRIRQGHGQVADGPIGPELTDVFPAVSAALAEHARLFDLDEARRRLDAAGYVDSNGDGVREDKAGKPIELTMIMPSYFTDFASAASFIVSWFGEIGVTVTPQTLDDGTFFSMASAPGPDRGRFDLALSSSWPFNSASAYLAIGATDYIGDTNLGAWSSPEFDALWSQLGGASGDELIDLATQASRMFQEQAPVLGLWYMDQMQAYRTDRIDGWVRQPLPDGMVTYNYYPEPTWSNIRPAGAASSPDASAEPGASASAAASAAPSASPAPGTTGTGGDTTPLLIGGAIVVLLLAGGALLLRRRGATA